MAVRENTIRRKLVRIVLLISGAVLLLASSTILTYEFLAFRQTTIQQASTLGEIIAANSTAALAFDNSDDAIEILSAVKAEQPIVAAGLYKNDGKLFAHYPSSLAENAFPGMPQEDGYRFDFSNLFGFQPVMLNGKRLGTLYARWDLKNVYRRFLIYGISVILIMTICLMAAAYSLSKILQRRIALPILELAETAKAVSTREDYSVRASKTSEHDEFILLTDTFNHMLERIQAQNTALKTSEERIRAVLNSAILAVIVIDAEGKIIEWNATAETMFGWSNAEVVGQELADTIIPPRFRETHRAGMARFMKTGRPVILGRVIQMTALRRDGTEFPVELSVEAIEANGAWTFCGFIADITVRKQAELKLQTQLSRMELLERITRATAERQDLASIFQVVVGTLEKSLPIDFGCVCVCESGEPAALKVAYIGPKSQALAAKLDMTPHSRIPIDKNGLSMCVSGTLVHEPNTAVVPAPFPQRLAAHGLHSFVAAPLPVQDSVFGVLIAARSAPHAFSSPDCEFIRHLSEHVATAAHQANLYGALQSAYDDLRQTQQAVMQQERLRALGQMASGIAHDINNAISPIALYTESLLEKEPALSERARGYLEITQHAIEDVAQTIARMREFYREREPQLALTPVHLNDLVDQVKNLTRARWSDMAQERGTDIRLVEELSFPLPTIMGVESEIRDALVNLIFNSVDALTDGGAITIRTNAASGMVYISVSDTGSGMDEATKRRCLEPFFTTKGERGTGLGLAMVYGMSQRHNAEIQVESEPGKGTTVQLAFPEAVESAPSRITSIAPTGVPLRILIVDDDPLLIRALRETLESDGHSVTPAAGGQEGIDLFKEAYVRSEPFNLVITDLGMPYVDGRKVAASIKALSPDTPIILFTGWGQRLSDDQNLPEHIDRVLNKPPKWRDIRTAITELTDAKLKSGPRT